MCTNLVHGIVPEVYYLHEVCHSCTNLVHGIVPEVYYLHEVCHSCTNLVHGIVPEVYYLYEVCHSCTNLVHAIVLKEQWIWPICDVLLHKLTLKVSKRSSALHTCTYPACKRTVSRTHLTVYRTCPLFATQNGSPASSSRLRLVLWELVSRGNAYPVMPHGRSGSRSKTCNQDRCACTHLEYNGVVWVIVGTLHVGNRYM